MLTIDYCSVEVLVQERIPLTHCVPHALSPIVIPPLSPKIENFEILKTEVEKLNTEITGLKDFNTKLLARLELLEGKMEQKEGKLIEKIDDESAKNEVQLVNELVTTGGVDDNETVFADLPDLDESLGFVVAAPVNE